MPKALGKQPRAGRTTSPPNDPRRWPAHPKGMLLSRAGLLSLTFLSDEALAKISKAE